MSEPYKQILRDLRDAISNDNLDVARDILFGDVVGNLLDPEIDNSLITVYFYGNDGMCLECNQPLEGAGCPYCGWDDVRDAQTKQVLRKKPEGCKKHRHTTALAA